MEGLDTSSITEGSTSSRLPKHLKKHSQNEDGSRLKDTSSFRAIQGKSEPEIPIATTPSKFRYHEPTRQSPSLRKTTHRHTDLGSRFHFSPRRNDYEPRLENYRHETCGLTATTNTNHPAEDANQSRCLPRP